MWWEEGDVSGWGRKVGGWLAQDSWEERRGPWRAAVWVNGGHTVRLAREKDSISVTPFEPSLETVKERGLRPRPTLHLQNIHPIFPWWTSAEFMVNNICWAYYRPSFWLPPLSVLKTEKASQWLLPSKDAGFGPLVIFILIIWSDCISWNSAHLTEGESQTLKNSDDRNPPDHLRAGSCAAYQGQLCLLWAEDLDI